MKLIFSYLYRDAGNFKNFASVVLSNTQQRPLAELEQALRSKLIDGLYFNAAQVNLPSVFFDDYDDELDHDWHEFESLELADVTVIEVPERDISSLIQDLAKVPEGANSWF